MTYFVIWFWIEKPKTKKVDQKYETEKQATFLLKY